MGQNGKEGCLFEGNIDEVRINEDKKYYKVSLKVSKHKFSVILLYIQDEYKLISCFIDNKKDLS